MVIIISKEISRLEFEQLYDANRVKIINDTIAKFPNHIAKYVTHWSSKILVKLVGSPNITLDAGRYKLPKSDIPYSHIKIRASYEGWREFKKTQKVHRCFGCREDIPIGSPAARIMKTKECVYVCDCCYDFILGGDDWDIEYACGEIGEARK